MDVRSRIEVENEARQAEMRKDRSQEDFLWGLNRTLRGAEAEFEAMAREDLPFLFVVGPPRSGTTLTMQLVAACLDVGYVDNVVGRFWLAVAHGVHLSRAVQGGRRAISYASRYGVTSDPSDPHEFGYFWSSHLGTRDEVKAPEDVDWTALRRDLARMAGAFARPVAFKNLITVSHVEGLARHLPRTCFVRVRRDHLDTGLSILQARERYYGDRNTWWSLRTPKGAALERLPWDEQIAAQLSFIDRHLDRSLDAALSVGARVVDINYETLCAEPMRLVDEAAQALEALGAPVARLAEPPPSFACERYPASADAETLTAALGRAFREGDAA